MIRLSLRKTMPSLAPASSSLPQEEIGIKPSENGNEKQ
jgi:hypothetical protein